MNTVIFALQLMFLEPPLEHPANKEAVAGLADPERFRQQVLATLCAGSLEPTSRSPLHEVVAAGFASPPPRRAAVKRKLPGPWAELELKTDLEAMCIQDSDYGASSSGGGSSGGGGGSGHSGHGSGHRGHGGRFATPPAYFGGDFGYGGGGSSGMHADGAVVGSHLGLGDDGGGMYKRLRSGELPVASMAPALTHERAQWLPSPELVPLGNPGMGGAPGGVIGGGSVAGGGIGGGGVVSDGIVGGGIVGSGFGGSVSSGGVSGGGGNCFSGGMGPAPLDFFGFGGTRR
ncbi:unnamed protein product [Phaeothamnion confervicola]